MTESEVLEKFSGVVAHSLRIDPAAVTPDSYLDELGAESLDLIEITMESESVFNIWLPEKSILETANEVYGPGVLEKEGFLTDEGRRLMLERMPEADAREFPDPATVEGLQRYFMRVSTWVHMIHGLMQYTPDVCPECGAALSPAAGMRMKCAACGQEIAIRSAEEINREWVRGYYENQRDAVRTAHEPFESSSINRVH